MAGLMHGARALIADTRGTAAIEGAIVAPFMIALGLGVAEYGNLLYNANLIQTGVRDAARYLARVENPQSAETAARNLAIFGTVTGEGPARVDWWSGGDIAISYESLPNWIDPATDRRAYRAGSSVTVVRVATSIDYAGLGTLAFIGQDSVTLNFAHEERVVGE